MDVQVKPISRDRRKYASITRTTLAAIDANLRQTYLADRDAQFSTVVRQRTALLRLQTLEGCGFQTMTFDPYVYYTTSAVTSAGVYPATRMLYCSGDAYPLLRVQSGSPEVSVTYQNVDHRKSFHVIAICLY